MKITIALMMTLLVALLAGGASAQTDEPGSGNGVCQFIDEDGDGFNDLAPDADGDGIPNGLDEDYVKPEDGTGNMWAYRTGQAEDFAGHLQGNGAGAMAHGHRYGPGDGTGTGIGPNDGTGFGPGEGTGDCDGDGQGDAECDPIQQRNGRR